MHKKNPNFKCSTVSVSLSAFGCCSVVVSSKEEKRKKQKKKCVWIHFCEFLSEAVAHLPATVSQLLLVALLTADPRSELNTHLALQALFI
jgi:hypothetical protein